MVASWLHWSSFILKRTMVYFPKNRQILQIWICFSFPRVQIASLCKDLWLTESIYHNRVFNQESNFMVMSIQVDSQPQALLTVVSNSYSPETDRKSWIDKMKTQLIQMTSFILLGRESECVTDCDGRHMPHMWGSSVSIHMANSPQFLSSMILACLSYHPFQIYEWAVLYVVLSSSYLNVFLFNTQHVINICGLIIIWCLQVVGTVSTNCQYQGSKLSFKWVSVGSCLRCFRSKTQETFTESPNFLSAKESSLHISFAVTSNIILTAESQQV